MTIGIKNKPFNLDLVKRGEPLVNRAGLEVFLTYVSPYDESRVLLFVAHKPAQQETMSFWTDKNGLFYDQDNPSDNDVFIPTKIKTYWLGIYKNDEGEIFPGIITDNEPDHSKSKNHVTTLSFEVEA